MRVRARRRARRTAGERPALRRSSPSSGRPWRARAASRCTAGRPGRRASRSQPSSLPTNSSFAALCSRIWRTVSARERRIERHRHVAGHPDREVAEQPVRAVLRQDRDLDAGREAERLQVAAMRRASSTVSAQVIVAARAPPERLGHIRLARERLFPVVSVVERKRSIGAFDHGFSLSLPDRCDGRGGEVFVTHWWRATKYRTLGSTGIEASVIGFGCNRVEQVATRKRTTSSRRRCEPPSSEA